MANKSDRERYIAENSEYSFDEDLFAFNMLNEETIEALKRGDISFPYEEMKRKIVNIPKDERWNMKQMTSKLMQGILQGDSIPKISESLLDVIHNNSVSATRAARTLVTQAENRGRIDSYRNLDEQGVVQEKVWIATPDSRTRASHLDVDGETVGINDTFSNGLEYPADPQGDPAEVYNCRCSMRTEIVGFRRADGSISRVDYERDDTMHESQMEEERERRGIEKEKHAEKPMPEKAPVEEFIRYVDEYNMLKTDITDAKVKYNEVSELSQDLTEKEIIEKLAGGDMTKGSCASLGLSYCANKAGLDVTDFRGGSSQDIFSQNSSISRMLKLANANIQEFKVQKESKDVAEIIKNIELNKEFLLATGKHVAIIKRTQEEGLQYLELQSSMSNGWKPFAYTIESKWGTNKVTVMETLQKRFGCRKTVDSMKIGDRKLVFEKKVTLADVDSFKKTDDFKEMLGYINTSTDKQKKGAGGFAK